MYQRFLAFFTLKKRCFYTIIVKIPTIKTITIIVIAIFKYLRVFTILEETTYLGEKFMDSKTIKITLEIIEIIVAMANFFSKTKKGSNPIIKIK